MRPSGLNRRTKLGYGSAELGIVAAEVLIELYLLKFYNVVVGLPSLYTALALSFAIVWDAVSDPIMGELSDRTHHQQGRRRPYFLPGAAAMALALILVFNPPTGRSDAFEFAYLLGAYLLLTTAMTVLSVPHLALAGELSFDRDERTEIFGYRRLFTTVGLVLGTLLPTLALTAAGQGESTDALARSRSLSSFALAAVVVLMAAIAWRSTRGLDRVETVRRAPLKVWTVLQSQLEVARYPMFRPLLAAFVIAGVGRAINASLALYYYEYTLALSESETVYRVLLPFFASIIASIPVWVTLSRRLGKKRPAFWGILSLGVLISIVYPALPPGRLEGPVAIAVVGGFLSGAIILLESLVADVVDADELATGYNREGLFFGMWRMGTKLTRAVGIVTAGLLLDVMGFDAQAAVQTKATAQRIAWVFGPGVGLFFVIGAFVYLKFPLTDERHRRIQRELLARTPQHRREMP